MVVSRKASATLPDTSPVSRSTSSTSIPVPKKKGSAPPPAGGRASPDASKAKGRDGKGLTGPEFTDPPKIISSSPSRHASSSAVISPSPSPKKSKKSSPSKKQNTTPAAFKSSTIMRPIRFAIMASFVTYSVIICPHDKENKLAFCRAKTAAETSWHRYIYDPYIQPHLNDISTHPNVVPILEPIARLTQPFTKRARSVMHSGTEKAYGLYWGYSTVAEEELNRLARPYVAGLQKQYDAQIDPYVSRYITPTYEVYILPALAQAEDWGKVAGTKLEPYLWRAAANLHHGIRQAQPYLLVAWGQVAQVPGLVREHAWEPLVDLRRTYVDPQVSVMMDAVNEAGGEAKAGITTPVPGAAAEVVEERVEDTEETGGAETVHTIQIQSETLPSEPPVATPTQSASEAYFEPEVKLTPFATQEPPVTSIEASGNIEVDDGDLDAFLRELEGQGDTQPEGDLTAPEPGETQTPEQAAERQRQKEQYTAQKRADIMRRHARWERKVKDLYEAKLTAFPELLGQLRDKEVSELEDGKHAEAMTRDVDRALRNMEALLKKLTSDLSKAAEEKIDVLESTVGKVSKRFDDGTAVVSNQVVTWLENARQKEFDLIERLVAEVRDLGTTAQGDVGLDYAWLDDVTVKDWARYHELLNASKNLQAKLVDLANGNDPNAPKNALSEAVRDLQLVLETTVARFRAELNVLHQQGVTSIQGTSQAQTPSSESSTSDEPNMSILPIDDGPDDILAEHVLMRKSKEQVEDVWRMAAGEARVEHAEL